MNRQSSSARFQPLSAHSIIAASRWQTVPVVICLTGTSARASRAASLSVARSPTSAATRHSQRNCASVFSSSVVLPDPGLETILRTKTPASRKRSRSARASRSFCFSTFLLTSISRGCRCMLFILQFQSFEFQSSQFHLPTLHNFRRRCAADGATKRLDRSERAFSSALRARGNDRHFLDQQARSGKRSVFAGQLICEKQRILSYAGKLSKTEMDGSDFAVVARCFFLGTFDDAKGDGQFVHKISV